MGSCGGSKWTTSSIPSTWMPRAATSVATTTWARPSRNRVRLRSRTCWLRSPCRSTAVRPRRSRSVRSSVAPRRVRVKTTARGWAATRRVRRVHLRRERGRHHDVVAHRLHRGPGVHLVASGIPQVRAHEPVDVAVEGGAQEQPLGRLRGRRQQPVDGVEEAQVAQLVGLVEHRDLDVVGLQDPLVDQVLQPARRAHDDVGGAAQRRHLGVVPGAAVDGDQPQLQCLGDGAQRFLDLDRELAGGHHHQRAWPVHPAPAARQAGHEREPEREGLARAGASPRQDVGAGERVGDDRGLHRAWGPRCPRSLRTATTAGGRPRSREGGVGVGHAAP